ncbi:putative ISXo8 transposase [Longimycelium tulufanense]|uniref:Putative ISXo8 transposase n=1 Tax=Longimycelium tulufanense TaxID=907463 RepID=A0A8J3C953_9PSEU|nr:transposase [Longimycelium tulufanense]GGM33305.1 putative ISXo8 transposase [Longimycelium tulufanense]
MTANDVILAELCSALFASLPRSDQRRKGVDYLRGLLEAKGRKSIRNIAARVGGPATEQSLHHFISSSTWDWIPVRHALARYLVRHAPPRAWVVRPMVIPKSGRHSVGVERRFFPVAGQVLNAQQAVGVWAASDELSAPIHWRLHVSKAWLDDGLRRNGPSVPRGVSGETLGDCVVGAYLAMVSRSVLPTLPVVVDAPETDVPALIQTLRAKGMPLLVRISSTLRLAVADPALAGHGSNTMPAYQILAAARGRRHPVGWPHHYAEPTEWNSPPTVVRVTLPPVPAGATPAQQDELLLLGTGKADESWPTELWLTDLTNTQPSTLLRLARLIHRVDRDLVEISEQVGIRDFAGRSFDGWHRHVTLASAAHAVAALTTLAGRRMTYLDRVPIPAPCRRTRGLEPRVGAERGTVSPYAARRS